jgi:hypothetical protein
MTATANPDGLRPSRIRGGSPNSAGANEYPIASGYASNIFNGDVVTNAAGYVNVLATTTDKAMGVFIGCRYVVDGEPQWSDYWPSGTSASDAYAMVVDNPQARTTGSAMLRPIAVVDEPGNDILVSAERAFPKLEVRIVRHVDAYISADASAN